MAKILYVDDDPEAGYEPLRAALVPKHTLTLIDLGETGWKHKLATSTEGMDIVISDLKLDERVDQQGDLDPGDGQAMNAVIRNMRRLLTGAPALEMIYSAALDADFAKHRTPDSPYAQADHFGAVWVGRKPVGAQASAFPAAARMFADAVDLVRGDVDEKRFADWLSGLLGLESGASWADQARSDIAASEAPVVAFFDSGDRLAIVSWIVHTGLRFPAFLIGIDELAIRLRVEPEWLSEQWSRDPGPWKALGEHAAYTGALADLDGPRWWRAGVDDFVWSATQGRAGDTSSLARAVEALCGAAPVVLEYPDPVLAYDEHGRSTGIVVDVSSAVRVVPPGWPLAAQKPWASLARAKTKPLLASLVVPEHRQRLGK